jgi:hypothetical protein
VTGLRCPPNQWLSFFDRLRSLDALSRLQAGAPLPGDEFRELATPGLGRISQPAHRFTGSPLQHFNALTLQRFNAPLPMSKNKTINYQLSTTRRPRHVAVQHNQRSATDKQIRHPVYPVNPVSNSKSALCQLLRRTFGGGEASSCDLTGGLALANRNRGGWMRGARAACLLTLVKTLITAQKIWEAAIQ